MISVEFYGNPVRQRLVITDVKIRLYEATPLFDGATPLGVRHTLAIETDTPPVVPEMPVAADMPLEAFAETR